MANLAAPTAAGNALALKELLDRIDEMQARFVAAGPLSASAKEILDIQLRLEWNYNSNVMEGNSLTRQETRTLMLGSQQSVIETHEAGYA